MRIQILSILILIYRLGFSQIIIGDTTFVYNELFVKNKGVVVASGMSKSDSFFQFKKVIKTQNIIIGEMHYHERNFIIYKEVLEACDSNTFLFIEQPFFMNIIAREWVQNGNSLIFDFQKDLINFNSHATLNRLIDSVVFYSSDSGKSALKRFRFFDINSLDIAINRIYTIEIIKLFTSDQNVIIDLNYLKSKKKWSNRDWKNIYEIVLSTNFQNDSLLGYFRETLLFEIKNKRKLPSGYFSPKNKFANREKQLRINFNYLKGSIDRKSHYFVITGVAHCSRDNSINLNNRDKNYLSFTNGLNNSIYVSLFYYTDNLKPYQLHQKCKWEKIVLKKIPVNETIFPIVIDVRRYNSSYDYMIIL
jgi:hypothetical protein